MWHSDDLTFLDGPAPSYDPASEDVVVWLDVEERPCAYGFTVDGWRWLHLPNAGSYRFRGSGLEAVRDCGVVVDEGASRSTVLDSFYRTVVPLALQAGGLEVLHSSAVRLPAGVLALCALSETGKSTLAYALHRRGHPLVADDAVVLDVDGAATTITPVPFAMRLREASAKHFDRPSKDQVRVTAASRGEPTETTDGWVEGRDDDRLALAAQADPLPMAAIAVLERVREDGTVHGRVAWSGDAAGPTTADDLSPAGSGTDSVTVERLAAASAFREILPHAYSFSLADGERKRRMMQAYLQLVSAVPVYRLRFRTGLEHLDAITEALERLGDPPTS
ncbi:MAG: hypothetical protein R6W77_04385 [Trueperaceae bacterium]